MQYCTRFIDGQISSATVFVALHETYVIGLDRKVMRNFWKPAAELRQPSCHVLYRLSRDHRLGHELPDRQCFTEAKPWTSSISIDAKQDSIVWPSDDFSRYFR